MQEVFEDSLADFLQRRVAFQDVTAIDVHVLYHMHVHWRVGGQLDRRRRFCAKARTAPGGERDKVGATGDLARCGNRVEAGRIHEDEPFCLDRFGVAVDFHHRARPALHRRPQ